jgi:hypothetical protein
LKLFPSPCSVERFSYFIEKLLFDPCVVQLRV